MSDILRVKLQYKISTLNSNLAIEKWSITETNLSVGISQTISWEKYGKVICLTSQNNTDISSENQQIFLNLALPESIRPSDYKAVPVFQYTASDNNQYVGRVMVYPDGKVRYSIQKTGVREFRWAICYLID